MSSRSILRRFVVAALLALCACAVNPVTGHRELTLMTESQEIALGKQADPQIVAEFGLYDDAALQAYVNDIGQKMAKLSHRPNLEYTFRVLDSPVINAFALPGGYIYITRGILAHMNNEAELAMVLGHEIGHVTARHGVRQQTKAQLASLGLGIGSVFSETVARLGETASQAIGLLFLKFGRDDERQADQLGVEYSLKAGWDAEVGCKFFEVLDRQSQSSGSSLPGWLSTHPAPAERVATTRQLSHTQKAQFPGGTAVDEAQHKRSIDGVVFGEDPRQGFVEGSVFKHPALRFQVSLPQGWKVANMPSAVVAVEPRQQAKVQLTMEPSQGATAAQYAARLAQSAQARVVDASSENVHGSEAYIAILEVPQEGGAAVPVLLGCVQRESRGPIYQFVGLAAQGAFATYRNTFLGTIRSLQALTDQRALAVQPNRIDVEAVGASTTLEQAVARAASPVPVGTVALLNNLQPATSLARGFQLKLVKGTYRGGNGA